MCPLTLFFSFFPGLAQVHPAGQLCLCGLLPHPLPSGAQYQESNLPQRNLHKHQKSTEDGLSPDEPTHREMRGCSPEQVGGAALHIIFFLNIFFLPLNPMLSKTAVWLSHRDFHSLASYVGLTMSSWSPSSRISSSFGWREDSNNFLRNIVHKVKSRVLPYLQTSLFCLKTMGCSRCLSERYCFSEIQRQQSIFFQYPELVIRHAMPKCISPAPTCFGSFQDISTILDILKICPDVTWVYLIHYAGHLKGHFELKGLPSASVLGNCLLLLVVLLFYYFCPFYSVMHF